MGKVAIVGLDGLSWDILLPYIEFLPSLRSLLSSSILGSLDCRPPLTPPSWTSIFTGVNPEKHGILGFTKYLKRGLKLTHRFYNAADVTVPRISEILAFRDYSSVLVNHVLSHPLSAWYYKNHIIVYDCLSPREFIYPSAFHKYLRYFKYPSVAQVDVGSSQLLDKWSKLIEFRIEGTIKLVEQVSPDLLIKVISETDSAMHRVPPIATPKFVEEYLRILTPIDSLIHYVMKHFNTVVLVSDHGLRLVNKGINLQLLSKAIEEIEETNMWSLKRLVVSLALSSQLLGLIYYCLMASKKTYNLFDKLTRRLMKSSERQTNGNSQNSGVYFDLFAAAYGMVYFKDQKKRECAYKVLTDTLGDFLEEVRKVEVGCMPSLRVTPKHGYTLCTDVIHRKHNSKIIYFAEPRHNTFGIFALWRKGGSKFNNIGVINNVDVVPTILSDLGVPLPSYTDGNSLIDGKPKFIDYRPRWLASKKAMRMRARLTQTKINVS